jgi:hypothetical protein
LVNNGRNAAKLPNILEVFLSHDGLNCETIVVMGKLLKKIPDVRANPSNQPTCIDCDFLGHVFEAVLHRSFGETLSIASSRSPEF